MLPRLADQLLVTPIVAIHLLAVNLAAAGPLVAVWLGGRAMQLERARRPRRLLRLSLAALALGIVLGGLLVVAPNPRLTAALERFPASAYWFAAAELAFSAGCIGALSAGLSWTQRWPGIAWLVALASASNLLYHFPPLMIVLGKLAANPVWDLAPTLDRSAVVRDSVRPEVFALWIHVVLASLSVAPVAAIWLNREDDREQQSPAGRSNRRRLATWALGASLLQFPAGAWLLAATPGRARESLLGGDPWTSVTFAAGLFATAWLLKALTELALGDERNLPRRHAAWALIAVTMLMTSALRDSRQPSYVQAEANAAEAMVLTAARRAESPTSSPDSSRTQLPLDAAPRP